MTRPDAHDPPRLSVCQSIIGWQDTADDLDDIIATGAGAVALMGTALRTIGSSAAAQLLVARRLAASSYHAGLQVLALDDAQADLAIGNAIAEGAAIGAPIVAVSAGPAGQRTSPEADEVFVQRLRRAAPLARDHGVQLGIEPLHPLLCAFGHVHSLRHGAELADRVEGCCVILDIAQLFWERDLHADIDRHIGSIGLVQLGQLSRPDLAGKRWVRAPFHDGAVPMADIIRTLHAAGYRGDYEHENRLPGAMTRAARIASIRADVYWFRALW